MLGYILPLVLVVLSNTVYQICAKGVPNDMNPFASLTVTYFVGMILSAVMYFISEKGGNIISELGKTNFASVLLGAVVVGLEVGWIYAYKAGWQVSVATVVQSSFLALILIFVGYFLYKEAITWNKLVGIAICLIGLLFINLK